MTWMATTASVTMKIVSMAIRIMNRGVGHQVEHEEATHEHQELLHTDTTISSGGYRISPS